MKKGIVAFILMPLLWGGDGTQEGANSVEAPKVFSSVNLKFWGRVVMNVHYDTDDVRGTTDFATYLSAEGNEEVNFNPRDTRLGFSATSEKGPWKTGLTVETDFYGDNAANNLLPRLRLGYVFLENDKGLSFRAGQDWIPLGQQNPGMIDFGILAWGGNLWWRVPQLTLRKKLEKIELLGSLMKHRVSSSQENQEDMPWAIGRVAWTRRKNLTALGFGYRSVKVEGHNYDPFAIVLEGKYALGSSASLTAEIWTGGGIGREFIRYGLDYNPDQDKEIGGKGGFVSLNLKIGESGSFNLGYGLDDPKDKDTRTANGSSTIAGVPFLKNGVAFANIQRKINKQFTYGFEVLHFDTTQPTGNKLTGQRFTASFGYVF